jgi:hypothetical protein
MTEKIAGESIKLHIREGPVDLQQISQQKPYMPEGNSMKYSKS